MSMFESYDNLGMSVNTSGISINRPSFFSISKDALPRLLYDIKNRFIGYEWSHGDTFDFKINASDTIKINHDSIVFNESDVVPTSETEGYIGQQAFNTVDGKCWTCLGLMGGLYVWIEEDKIYYPEDGDTEIDFKTLEEVENTVVEIFNFRWEPIMSFANEGAEVICPITKEINDRMLPGIYYATVTITIGGDKHIKNKFTIVVR